MRSILTPVLFAFLTLGTVPSMAMAQDAPASEAARRTLSVTGEGEIRVAPDLARVAFGVLVEGVTEADVMDDASTRTAAMIATLTDLGITGADVQTGAVRLTPRYGQTLLGGVDYTKIEGFTATNTLRVKIRDINAVGDVLAAVIGAGANTVDEIGFGLQDEVAARDAARRAAVAEAMRLAALYADAAQVGLGPVMTIVDGGGYGGFASPVMESSMDSMSSRGAPKVSVPVAPGELLVSANVSMIFQLVD